MADKFPLEIKDPTGLTDKDWAHINAFRKAYETGGVKALSRAMEALGDSDPVQMVRVMGAFFPDEVRETLKDAMAEKGLTREDLQEMIKKAEGRRKIQ